MHANGLTVRRVAERAATLKIVARNSRHRVPVLAGLDPFPDGFERPNLFVLFRHAAIMPDGEARFPAHSLR